MSKGISKSLLLKKLMIFLISIVILFSFSGCNNTQNISIAISQQVLPEESESLKEDTELKLIHDSNEEADKEGEENTESSEMMESSSESEQIEIPDLHFRNAHLLNQHYKKHGIEMGFDSEEAYEQAAALVTVNPEALHKKEKEDGDDVYYVESSNEFVVVSGDGYLRTYFHPDRGIKYFNGQ